MNRLTTFKMFCIFPIMHLLLIYGIATSEYWYLILILGFLIHYPIHQLGGSIGYHKLFAHRSFVARPWFVYLSTFVGTICFFGDPLTYATIHRIHHKYSDTDKDPHSPIHGRFRAYMSWMIFYHPAKKDLLLGLDLIRDYPWMLKFKNIEWLVPLIFYTTLFFISPLLCYMILLGCLLSIHSMFFANAFGHSVVTRQALNNKTLAKFINPVFMHHQHHNQSTNYDYGFDGVADRSVWFIRRILTK